MTADAYSISVVIPAYQAENTLGRCLESVLAQTRSADEVIVVDDGSKDRTFEIAASFGNRVRCIRQENAGAAAARNRGVAESVGSHIAFLDADDIWKPEHLARAEALLKGDPELKWYASCFEIRASSGESEVRGLTPQGRALLVDGRYLRSFFEAIGRGCEIWTSTVVAEKGLISQAGGFAEDMVVGEDVELWFKMAFEHPSVAFGQETDAVYIRSDTSLSAVHGGDAENTIASTLRHSRNARKRGRKCAVAARPFLRYWTLFSVKRAIVQGNRRALARVVIGDRHAVSLSTRLLAVVGLVVPLSLVRAIRRRRGR